MPTLPVLHSIKNEVKENLSVSISLVASQMVFSCTQFIGTAMVATLGKDALAASVLVNMIWMTVSILFIGILNATSVLVAHQYGAKNHTAITDIMGQSYLLSIIMSVLLMLVLLTLPMLIRFTPQPASVLLLADQYIYSQLWTIPGLMIIIASEQFLAGISQTKLVLRISLLIVPLEIIMMYILIFGKFNLPKCGIAGIGYGFAISYSVTGLGLAAYLFRAKAYQPYQIFSRITHIHFTYIKELLRVGIPMGFMHVIEIGAFAIATVWIAQFGTIQVAAHQIAIQYLSFIITFIFAMAQAVTIRVGNAVGKQDIIGVCYATYTGIAMSTCVVILIMLACVYFPEFFLMLDLDIHNPANAILVKNASMLIAIVGVLIIFDNIRLICFGALRGLKDTRFPMYASIASFWVVGLSVGYLFGFIYHGEDVGIWWGSVSGIAVGAVILLLRFQYLLNHIDLSKVLASSR